MPFPLSIPLSILLPIFNSTSILFLSQSFSLSLSSCIVLTTLHLPGPYRVTLEIWNPLEDVANKWREEGEAEEFVDSVKEVFEYIHSRREVGASICELKVCMVYNGYVCTCGLNVFYCAWLHVELDDMCVFVFLIVCMLVHLC